jgi:O-antigen/teichoic acid export membrane protein
VVIGTFLSAAAITYFNIGSRIVDYAGEVVESLAQIFVPMSSHSEAVGDLDRLRKIFVAGNRACAFTFFPLAAILVVLGKSVIEAWVGQRYVEVSYPVLLILLASAILVQAQGASVRILMGIGQHRTWAIVTLVEGLVNLGLSIILVRRYGIVGDALGTTIPLAITMIFILPQHLCRKLEIRMMTYLHEAYTLPIIVCAPLIVALLLMERWFVPHSRLELLEQLALAGIVYGLCLAWAVASKRAMKMGKLHTPMMALETATAVETITHDA